jgi:hypothetical protein
MSQEIRQTELQEKTQKLLHGRLKYVRAAALAAALLPLASVAAAPMVELEQCSSAPCPPPPPPDNQPGTGTPGYWKTHPSAWPGDSITVGGISYTKEKAIEWLGRVGKDKTTTMFSSLVSAKLNVIIGNYSVCVDGDIAAGDDWMATYGPVGKNVLASSPAWVIGEPIHIQLDSYNNGLLCAPHRL